MQIGALAKQSGLGVETVRFYEKQGLLKAERSASGYRHFGADAPARLRFVPRAKSLGFTLDEIRDLLGLRLDPGATKQDVRQRTRSKLEEIEKKAAQLEAMKRALQGLLDCCHGRGKASECPILDSLEK
jgi:DNA-binding transcriptional MerR regulator